MALLYFLIWILFFAGVWYGVLRLTRSNGIKPWLGHLAGIPLGLIVSGVIVGSLPTTDEEIKADPSSNVVQNEKAKEIMSVTAVQLFSDYHANEVSADSKYKDKNLSISGRVAGISKSAFDSIYLELSTQNQFMLVQAHMLDSEHDASAKLRRGQTVTLLCLGNGMVLGSPMLNDCRISDISR